MEAYNYASATQTIAQEAQKLASDASTKATSAESKAIEVSEKVAGKQDTLISGSTIKTINGESILGNGDIKVAAEIEMPYSELPEASLNSLKTQGIYKIETATDIPDNTAAAGTLHVNKLDDTHYEQLWYSDSN